MLGSGTDEGEVMTVELLVMRDVDTGQGTMVLFEAIVEALVLLSEEDVVQGLVEVAGALEG